jgi:hypothetical protein
MKAFILIDDTLFKVYDHPDDLQCIAVKNNIKIVERWYSKHKHLSEKQDIARAICFTAQKMGLKSIKKIKLEDIVIR